MTEEYFKNPATHLPTGKTVACLCCGGNGKVPETRARPEKVWRSGEWVDTPACRAKLGKRITNRVRKEVRHCAKHNHSGFSLLWDDYYGKHNYWSWYHNDHGGHGRTHCGISDALGKFPKSEYSAQDMMVLQHMLYNIDE